MNLQLSTFGFQPLAEQGKARWLVVALFSLLGGGSVLAQANLPGAVSGFNVAQYYPAPNFRQMEMKLTGAAGTLVPGTVRRFRIAKPAFISFEPNGETQITIETPECIFDDADPKARRVSSTEQLTMWTGDGRFSIKGQGFLWRQSEKILIISNDVHAVIQWTNNAPPLEITSRWFEFDAERRQGIFHDEVRGEDTNQVFTCARLIVTGGADKTNRKSSSLAQSNRGSFDQIEAEGGLEIIGKVPGRYAKAQRGVYHHAEQRVDLIGGAEWKFEGRAGRAERMTAWTNAENVEAVGQVVVSMPQTALGAAGGFLSSTNAPGKTPGTNMVTLFADRFTKRGDRLLAEGAVRVDSGTNQLTCDRLEAQAPPRSPDGFAAAIGKVFVGRADGGIHSERADYSKSTGEVLFTGNPRFLQNQVSGTAERVIVRPATSEVLADNGVVVALTFAAGSDTFLNILPDAKTNRVASANRTNQTVQITARTFALRDQKALFTGNVEAHQLPKDGSEQRMRCGELEVQFTADQHAESVQARQEVVCERGLVGVTNGPAEYTRMDSQTLTARANPATGELVDLVAGGGVRVQQADGEARGDKAVYTRADQILKLIGQAVIDRPEAIYTSRQGLAWHMATKQVVGNYDSIRFKEAALKRAEESQTLPPK